MPVCLGFLGNIGLNVHFASAANAPALGAKFLGGIRQKLIQHLMKQFLARDVALGGDQGQAFVIRLRQAKSQFSDCALSPRKRKRKGRRWGRGWVIGLFFYRLIEQRRMAREEFKR